MKSTAKKTSKKKVLIIGAREDGLASIVMDAIHEDGKMEIIGFVDNDTKLGYQSINGIPILGRTDDIDKLKVRFDVIHIAIGDNLKRLDIAKKLKKKWPLATVVHPTANIGSNVTIGEGSFIGVKAVINYGTVLGQCVIVGSGAILENNCRIADGVHVAAGVKVADRVCVGEGSFLGLGSVILPDIKIGSFVMVDAAANVSVDVADQTTVASYSNKKHQKNIYQTIKPDVVSHEKVYVAKPTLPEYVLIEEKFKDIASSLMLSNFAKYATQFENKLESSLSVKRALTFPNCTSALMLALKAMGLTGEVILPSFTFSSSGHAVVWNGLMPVFADIDRKTFNVDPDDIKRKITKKTSAILAVHVFGCPANIPALEKIAKENKIKLIFDAAHALGSVYNDKPIGSFGDIECFSLSGTKVITSAEGGIATSNDEALMDKMSLGRNYGAGPDYDCQYIGLNGKMSEFHAAIGLESMALLDDFVAQRNKLVNLYKERLNGIPGLSFQHVPKNCVSSYKDFSMLVDEKKFGISRDELVKKLQEEHIYTKKYFFPLHRMEAYKHVAHRAEGLSNTEYVADHIICLPIFSHMSEDTVEKICYIIHRLWLSKNR